MRKLTINGVEYDFQMNLKATINFERLSNKPAFDLQQFTDGKVEPLINMGYAILSACNKGLPEPDDFIASITDANDVATLVQATSEELMRFYKLQPGDAKPEEEAKEEEGDAPKNK